MSELKSLGLVLLAFAFSGCVVEPVRERRVVVVEEYEPVYCDGYVVYYTEDGAPFYYREDVVYYVPQSHPRFSFYVSYYRSNRPAYQRWRRRGPARPTGPRRPPPSRGRPPAPPPPPRARPPAPPPPVRRAPPPRGPSPRGGPPRGSQRDPRRP